MLLKKKNPRPGEDYSVYKSKAAACSCNGILFKKKNLTWQSPFKFEFMTNVKNRYGIKE